MKKLLPLVALLSIACAGAKTKTAPVVLGCGPTQFTRPINAASKAVLKICFLSDGSVVWADGQIVPEVVPAPAPTAPAPAEKNKKKTRKPKP